MAKKMNDRRQKVLHYIIQYMEEKSYAPSYRDIQAAVQCGSTSTIHNDIHALIDMGYLNMDEGNYRSLTVVQKDEETSSVVGKMEREDVYDIPRFGKVAAGAPIYADDYIEDYVPLPSSFFPHDGKEYFILTISGESMIEAGIYDGDHVICRKESSARNGEQVVALIENEATVKTFYKRSDHIELRPENSFMEPIRVKECMILGIVVGLYRLY